MPQLTTLPHVAHSVCALLPPQEHAAALPPVQRSPGPSGQRDPPSNIARLPWVVALDNIAPGQGLTEQPPITEGSSSVQSRPRLRMGKSKREKRESAKKQQMAMQVPPTQLCDGE